MQFSKIKVVECLYSFLLNMLNTTLQSFTLRYEFKDPVKLVLVDTELKVSIKSNITCSVHQ